MLPLPGWSEASRTVKAVCDRGATAPVELSAECIREDDLYRTCPAKVMAAIENRDRSGRGRLTLKRQCRAHG
jgi:hypothetical protein